MTLPGLLSAEAIVTLADLDKELPKGVKRVDAAGREAQIAARQAGYARRDELARPVTKPVDADAAVVAVEQATLPRHAGVAQWQSSSFPS